MIGGALVNATAFVGGSYLANYLSGDQNSAEEEKKRHDLAVEKYQAAYEKYQEHRTKLLDWIVTNDKVKEQAKQNFVDTGYALNLHNKVHNQELDLREPKLSNFYKPRVHQKQGEIIYVGGMALALGLNARRFLWTQNKMEKKISKIYHSPKGFWKGLPAVKKLAQEDGVSEDVAKLWLMRQAIWQIYFPAPKHIPRSTFDF